MTGRPITSKATVSSVFLSLHCLRSRKNERERDKRLVAWLHEGSRRVDALENGKALTGIRATTT
jgi:hypothetical protein